MLLQKTEMDFLFKKKIEKKDEELFILGYNVLIRSIKGLTNEFIVNAKRLKELLLTNEDKTYCKFYYLEDNNSLNIGLSFSNNEDCPILENEDVLYILNDELFIKTDFNNFSNLVNDFDKGIGNKLLQHTNVKNTLVSYDFDTIATYILALEFHFQVSQLKFNMFKFCPADLNGNIILYSTDKDDKISFCVHAIINSFDNKNILIESDGYDLGNLRP